MLSEGSEAKTIKTYKSKPKQQEIDWKFVQTIFEFQSYLFPITKRKIITWCLYLLISSSLYLINRETQLFKNIREGIHEEIAAITFLTYGIEPLMLLLYMSLVKYPYFEPPENNTLQNDAVLIIPCHLSAKTQDDRASLERVLIAALKHFKPDHIFVIDNGKTLLPQDNTKECAQAVNSEIHYKYYANPNKTTALYVGLKMAQAFHGRKIKYALFTDDDVEIPPSFFIQKKFFEDKKIRGIIYPILATTILGGSSLLVSWQNIEYQLSDLTLGAFDTAKAAAAPHGACMVLDVNTAGKIFERHTGLFKGEDKEVGEHLRSLYDPEGALKFRVDMNCFFKTNVPESYFGSDGNLWGQRVRSWAEAPYLYFWRLVLKPVLTDWRYAPLPLVIVKLDQIYNLMSQLANIFRYLLIASEAGEPFFWLMFGILTFTQFLIVSYFNYVKLPPYLRNDFLSILTFPLYKQIDNFLSHMAFWRVLLFTFAKESAHPPIKELLEQKKIPAFDFDVEAQSVMDLKCFEFGTQTSPSKSSTQDTKFMRELFKKFNEELVESKQQSELNIMPLGEIYSEEVSCQKGDTSGRFPPCSPVRHSLPGAQSPSQMFAPPFELMDLGSYLKERGFYANSKANSPIKQMQKDTPMLKRSMTL